MSWPGILESSAQSLAQGESLPMPGLAAVFGVLLVGVAATLANAINGMTGRQLGILRATWLFLTVGTLASLPLAIVWDGPIRWERLAGIPPYLFIPGLVNLLFICLHIWLVNTIGTVLTSANVFVGEMVMSLALDHLGVAGLRPIAATPGRVVAAAILLVGVALLVKAGLVPSVGAGGGETGRSQRRQLMAVGAALLLGMALSTTMTLNARLGQLVGPLTSTTMFLLPGSLFLSVYLIWDSRRSRRGQRATFDPRMLLPGLINVLTVAGGIILIPLVGVQVMRGGSFTAGVLTGLLVDNFGLFGLGRYRISPGRLSSAAVLVVGVLVAIWSSQ